MHKKIEKLLVIGNFRRVIKLRYRKNYKSFSRNVLLYSQQISVIIHVISSHLPLESSYPIFRMQIIP
jgi:hypothetical protein